jgi:N-acetyl sugar amidotransferase
MKYCKKCLIPDTRPGINFENDVCLPCINYERQKTVDWDKRMKEFEILCNKYRGCNGSGYDCAIAVSGGKDSHFQTFYMKEVMKMNPVLLSVGNLDWSETGKKNIDNLSDAFGCDIIEFKPNRKLARKMLKKGFEDFGTPTWYIDALIYAFPVKMAINLDLKLLVYGENVNHAYGGKDSEETPSAIKQRENNVVKPIWEKWFENGEISENELKSVRQPSYEECQENELESIYLSYYVPWDAFHNYKVAKRWGFHHLGHEYQREGSLTNFDQIDSLSYLVHPFLKYPKFGHSIVTDYACRLIRAGIKTREEMIPIVEENDGILDQGSVDIFCEFTKLSHSEFWNIVDKWYNEELFFKDKDGIWHPKFKIGSGLIKK